MERWLETFARANFRRSADTAHDLKTPLNVAVLNLELLRMRLRKLADGEDEKLAAYTAAIEMELRRLGRIFDCFFLLSTPPKNSEAPERVDVAAIASDVASAAGFAVDADGPAMIEAHEARIRQACRMFFEGASSVLQHEGRRVSVERGEASFTLCISGAAEGADFELTKILKFYYTDPHGDPDLSLATARLIAETYGGELAAALDEHDKVSLRLSFPLGAR
ncbi:MAG TPA: histidine kinase dimerization/phospho-acceptor domain-containing protein [Thermoanaerobaculia bacterium]|nr:histidine kinase dimerization/phospho-acceptor domain-containing protein [Thermoanaerobaculia bacterium]